MTMVDSSSVRKVSIQPLRSAGGKSSRSIFSKELLNRVYLHQHINGTETIPADTDHAKLKAFKKTNGHVSSRMVVHLGKEVETNVSGRLDSDGSAKDVWDMLMEIYQKDNLPAVLNLRINFFQITH